MPRFSHLVTPIFHDGLYSILDGVPVKGSCSKIRFCFYAKRENTPFADLISKNAGRGEKIFATARGRMGGFGTSRERGRVQRESPLTCFGGFPESEKRFGLAEHCKGE